MSRAIRLAVIAVAATATGRGQSPDPGTSPTCPSEPAPFHACAQDAAANFNAPKTKDGTPDLQGFWRGPAHATENIEEHPKTDDDGWGKEFDR